MKLELVRVNGDMSNARMNHSLVLLRIARDMGLRSYGASKRAGRPVNKQLGQEVAAIRKLADDLYYE